MNQVRAPGPNGVFAAPDIIGIAVLEMQLNADLDAIDFPRRPSGDAWCRTDRTGDRTAPRVSPGMAAHIAIETGWCKDEQATKTAPVASIAGTGKRFAAMRCAGTTKRTAVADVGKAAVAVVRDWGASSRLPPQCSH